ncbi:hypothetical protein CGMCC3_g12452 [Colletotrichum fructicola]|nr:uncharacterized protein CGMCC3_g12452 [Colletotrichum fructicola]KAE9571590.1 hypothetical protein CGMCC3_g12452 [Colletotrichum fructicola]
MVAANRLRNAAPAAVAPTYKVLAVIQADAAHQMPFAFPQRTSAAPRRQRLAAENCVWHQVLPRSLLPIRDRMWQCIWRMSSAEDITTNIYSDFLLQLELLNSSTKPDDTKDSDAKHTDVNCHRKCD